MHIPGIRRCSKKALLAANPCLEVKAVKRLTFEIVTLLMISSRISEGFLRDSTTLTAPREKNLDATKLYAHSYREQGRFNGLDSVMNNLGRSLRISFLRSLPGVPHDK